MFSVRVEPGSRTCDGTPASRLSTAARGISTLPPTWGTRCRNRHHTAIGAAPITRVSNLTGHYT